MLSKTEIQDLNDLRQIEKNMFPKGPPYTLWWDSRYQSDIDKWVILEITKLQHKNCTTFSSSDGIVMGWFSDGIVMGWFR